MKRGSIVASYSSAGTRAFNCIHSAPIGKVSSPHSPSADEYKPQCTNIPKRASFHQAIRACRSPTDSVFKIKFSSTSSAIAIPPRAEQAPHKRNSFFIRFITLRYTFLQGIGFATFVTKGADRFGFFIIREGLTDGIKGYLAAELPTGCSCEAGHMAIT